MATCLQDLEAKVKEAGTPAQAGTALVNGVAKALDDLSQDPVAIKALAVELRGAADKLGEAIGGAKPAPHAAHPAEGNLAADLHTKAHDGQLGQPGLPQKDPHNKPPTRR